MLIQSDNRDGFELDIRRGQLFFRVPFIGQGFISRGDTHIEWHVGRRSWDAGKERPAD